MARPMMSRRWRQAVWSVPHYLNEIKDIRGWKDFHRWLYYKVPYLTHSVAPFPIRINLEPTNACNLSCSHCHRTIMDREIGFMDYSLFARIIEQFASHSNCVVKIVGFGEPALHPEFARMMTLLRARRVRSIVYTNGHLLERFPASEILGWHIPHLIVSVDGVDAASYAGIRIGGDLHRLRRALLLFYEARSRLRHCRPKIEVRHVIMPDEDAVQLRRFTEEWSKISDTVMFNQFIPLDREAKDVMIPGTRRRCRDIRREFYVRWDGKVPVCGYHESQKHWIGDLNSASIEDLWNHAELTGLRSLHSSKSSRLPSVCRSCVMVRDYR